MSDRPEIQDEQPELFDELPDQAPPLYLYADKHVLERCVPCQGLGGANVLVWGQPCWVDCMGCIGSGQRLVRRECRDAEIMDP